MTWNTINQSIPGNCILKIMKYETLFFTKHAILHGIYKNKKEMSIIQRTASTETPFINMD